MNKDRSVLLKYLELFWNNREFTEEELNYLEKYSVARNEQTKESEIVAKPEQFVKSHNLSDIKSDLQNIRSRFNQIRKRADCAFSDSFTEFLEWWCGQTREQKLKCEYCGVTVEEIDAAKNSGRVKKSQKRSFNTYFHVDRKNPNGGYNSKNCVLACVLCNNAKSDMISDTDFKKYFGKAMKDFWIGKKETD